MCKLSLCDAEDLSPSPWCASAGWDTAGYGDAVSAQCPPDAQHGYGRAAQVVQKHVVAARGRQRELVDRDGLRLVDART